MSRGFLSLNADTLEALKKASSIPISTAAGASRDDLCLHDFHVTTRDDIDDLRDDFRDDLRDDSCLWT